MVFDGAHAYIYDGYRFAFSIEADDELLSLLVTVHNQHDELIMEEGFPLGAQLARDWLLFERLLAAVGPRQPAAVQVCRAKAPGHLPLAPETARASSRPH